MNGTIDHAIFDAGDVVLQSGRTFPAMKIAYKTWGRLDADRSNVIVYPTSFSAQHHDTQWLIRPGGALDPERYFIVIPNLFGNGLSSSPSNTLWPLTGDRYPNVTYLDAVRVQQRLLAEVFGVERVRMVYGWSMGAMQAYHWASAFPDRVERIAVVCGSARCAPHNAVFIEGVRAALTADPAYLDGAFTARPVRGYRAMGRLYAGWAMSQEFYREELWRTIGFSSQHGSIRHWPLEGLKHSTIRNSGSVERTTCPMVINSAGRANRKPPDLPRTDSKKSSHVSWCITLRTWSSEIS